MEAYLRIAADLRRRIEDGSLAPGARVPSTRALARKWRVAPATAAHALRTLIAEGVLRGVARSGTLVAPPAGGSGDPADLSRGRLISAAIAIADAEGLQALSIRTLASRLHASPMALYRHVRDKDELISLMADAAVGEVRRLFVEPAPAGWRAQLELGARMEWRALKRHPWLARVLIISRPLPLPNGLHYAEWVLRALDGSRLSAPAKLQLHVLLHSFVQGLAVNVEAEAQARGETGIDDDGHMRLHEQRFAEVTASGDLPHFSKMLRQMPERFDLNVDALFELGLRALLDGFAPLVEGRRRTLSAAP